MNSYLIPLRVLVLTLAIGQSSLAVTNSDSSRPYDPYNTRDNGGSNGGGGDSSSPRVRTIKNWFGTNGQAIRPHLWQIGLNLNKLLPQGRVSARIKGLLATGLLNDFQQAAYVLKEKCVDRNGIERSATTQDVDRSPSLEIPAPPICINVRKLAADGATLSEIIGILYHEHARHFGVFDDTDELGGHPIATFISLRAEMLLSRELNEAIALPNGTAVFLEQNDLDVVVFFSESILPRVVISNLVGRLSNTAQVSVNTNKDKRMLGPLSVGSSYEIPVVTDLWAFLGFDNPTWGSTRPIQISLSVSNLNGVSLIPREFSTTLFSAKVKAVRVYLNDLD